MRTIEIDQKTVTYALRFGARRKTLGIEVHPGGRIEVIAPEETALDAVDAKVRLRAKWIWKQLAFFRRNRSVTPPRQFLRGETHRYLGRQYRLRLVEANSHSVTMTRGWIEVASPSVNDREHVKGMLERWYRRRARAYFQDILRRLESPFIRKGFSEPRIIIRTMTRRWGSLSGKGTMTLNLRLIQVPKACIEYVILHELCHLVHKTHSPQFFALLRRYMPDWEARKSRLEKDLL